MAESITRRGILKSGVAGGAFLGLGDLGFLSSLSPVSAEEATLDSHSVRLDAGVEGVVQLLEQTPRGRLLEEVAARIRRGLSYRELLAALLLAGVKNVEPRPSVGHKFHAVLVVNSAHLASLSSPAEHRWLPLFWALDYYKSSEAADTRENGGDWMMQRVDESAMPSADKAPAAFQRAMDRWDVAAADAAVAGLARTAGANQLYEMFFRLGMRDFRSIGHKAIFVANSYRTLCCVGWQHAEPVVRSLAYALLMHEGGNPADRDAEADRPYRRNLKLVNKFRPDWASGKLDSGATDALLQTLRSGSSSEACDHVVEIINGGAAPQSVWDALHLASSECVMQQPGIVALHAVTTSNALHFAYQTIADSQTRQLAMLQNAAFITMFRRAMTGRGKIGDTTLAQLGPETVEGEDRAAIDAIFADVSRNPMAAARKTLGYLRPEAATAPASPDGAKAHALIDAARLLVFLKGNNAHDYKFSSAILEDYQHVSPLYRDKFLAANMFKLRGSGDADNPLVQRTRAAL
jgi:hypothetical protein